MVIEIEDVDKMLTDYGFELSTWYGRFTKDGCDYYVYRCEVRGCLDICTNCHEFMSDILFFADYQDIEELTSAFEKLLQQFLMELL